MPDETYDVVIVGAGNKNMALACYLARYGGLKVGIFERRNELGGGLASEECAAPGFISNTHGTSVHDFYTLPLEWDFPELKEIALEQYKYWEPETVIIEAKATGTPLTHELRQVGIPVVNFTPSRGNDKLSRVHSISPLFEAGMIWAP
ncbi:MAG: NAD(P)-binding protein, partial [Planctomycetota bacterium]